MKIRNCISGGTTWMAVPLSAILCWGCRSNKPPEKAAEVIQAANELCKAVISGNLAEVELLIAKGADINAVDTEGKAPLHYAVRGIQGTIFPGKDSIIQRLIENGADVNLKGKDGFTPLHLAAATNNIIGGTYLITKGANVNAKNVNGQTPLHVTVYMGARDMAKALITAGAKLNLKDNDGNTPLEIAEFFNRKEFFELLKKQGTR